MSSPNSTTQDEALSIELARRCQAARARLEAEMDRLGMLPEAGWRITDKTRFLEGRTEIVFWPVHPYLPSPDGLECVVSINEAATQLHNTCDAK